MIIDYREIVNASMSITHFSFFIHLLPLLHPCILSPTVNVTREISQIFAHTPT